MGLNDYTAPNLKESLTGSSLTQVNYNLRNSYTDVALPKPKGIPKKSFKYSGAKLWNSLFREAKEAQSIHIFKRNINLCLCYQC
jgi:hypothetical protein